LGQQVVVITGASSGIGRETALGFARRGASLVLAARSEPALRELAAEIERIPNHSQALVVVTDVADNAQVDNLARQAVNRFGRIDTWVNDAAVSEYATVEQMAVDEIRRIVDVNLMGTVHGAKAALSVMRAQPGGGTIINVGSVLSDRAVPLQSAYVATKHAVKGFTDALRMELEHTGVPINVTLILPASMNTPFFDHARTHMGVMPKPIPPVYEPGVVARAILHAAEHKVREIYAGGFGKVLSVMQRISPRLVDWYMTGGGGRAFRQQRDAAYPSRGERDSLFEPAPQNGRTRGRFGRHSMAGSIYSRWIDPHPNVKGALIGLAVLGGAAALVGIGRATKPQRKRIVRQVVRPTIRSEIANDLLFKDLYYPTLSALQDAGYRVTEAPVYDRFKARFARALAHRIARRA
jgi:short-subunit dehydrogenase